MNNYFRKSWLIGILVVIALFFFYEVIKFSALSFTPITKISNKTGYVDSIYPIAKTLVDRYKDNSKPYWTKTDIDDATKEACDRITDFIFS